MKLQNLFLLLIGLFAFSACGDDDASSSDPNELSYDGNNSSSPELEPGVHVLSLYFPATDLQSRIGKKLHEVEVYADQGADSYKVKLFGPGTASEPGPELRSVDFTGQVNGKGWAIVDINPPLDISGDDLWIAVEVLHSQTAQTIGCDSGPRKDGGDWIWSSNTSTWETFFARTGTERVNWNIKGHLID